jgi:hypothetical protein
MGEGRKERSCQSVSGAPLCASSRRGTRGDVSQCCPPPWKTFFVTSGGEDEEEGLVYVWVKLGAKSLKGLYHGSID